VKKLFRFLAIAVMFVAIAPIALVFTACKKSDASSNSGSGYHQQVQDEDNSY